MVVYAPQTEQMRPMDTGAVFDGRVHVWLFTDDPLEAAACGRKLRELGLPRRMQLIRTPSVRGVFAINPHAELRRDPRTGRWVPGFLRYRQYPMVLETDDQSDLMRFYKWLHAKNPNVAPPETTQGLLPQLADEGKIDTIEAG